MGNVSSKRDSNEAPIVKALLDAGCSVQLLRGCSKGTPDLLVGHAGKNYLLEVKAPGGELSDDQIEWHRKWMGRPVVEVRTVEEALAAVGVRIAA